MTIYNLKRPPLLGLCLLFSCFFFISATWKDNQPSMILQFNELESQRGQICVAVYKCEQTFMQPDAHIRAEIYTLDEFNGTIKLQNLPYGQYAIAVFQDLNGNEKLDTNVFGVPKEPYGFSNNLRVKWRKPRFDEAQVRFAKDGQVVPVQLLTWQKQ